MVCFGHVRSMLDERVVKYIGATQQRYATHVVEGKVEQYMREISGERNEESGNVK